MGLARAGGGQRGEHLGVVELVEIVVVQPDRMEREGLREAHDVVNLVAQRLERVGRRDRHREHEPAMPSSTTIAVAPATGSDGRPPT